MMNRGVVAISADVTHEDTAARALFTLPPGATPLFAVVQVLAAFDDTGTDLVDLGIPGDDDYFANDVDVSAVGGSLVVVPNATVTGQTALTAKYTGANGDAAAGRATVTLVYASPFELR